MHRLGFKRELNFALPADKWLFDMFEPFAASMVTKEAPWGAMDMDIFAFHSRWNYAEVRKLIPEATFVTLLRDPVECFESNYVYMGWEKQLNMSVSEYATRVVAPKRPPRNPKAYVGKNMVKKILNTFGLWTKANWFRL